MHTGTKALRNRGTHPPCEWGRRGSPHLAKLQGKVKEFGKTKFDTFIADCVYYLKVSFVMCAGQALQAIKCEEYGGVQRLKAVPDIECFSPDHLVILIPAAVMFAESLCIPVVILFVLLRGDKKAPAFRRRFGFLFAKFEPSFFWWEATFYARNVTYVVVNSFGGEPTTQATWLIMLNAALIMLQTRSTPFNSRHN